MTTDAGRDVPQEDLAEDDAADAGRPSLADWLVVSVRPSQMPPAAESEGDSLESPDERFVADPDAEPDLDEELAAVLLSPAARARRGAFFRGAFFLLGAALVLFFLGRWFVRSYAHPKTAESTVVLAPLPAPAPVVSAVTAEPEEELAEEEATETEQSPPGALESTGRAQHAAPPDSTSTAPIVAPAWSVARFPDLPRDVLIACEQAALQAHSAASAETPAPPIQ